ncbi:MAG: glucose-6-phosphate dehydrogenase [Bacteroidota bacterium]
MLPAHLFIVFGATGDLMQRKLLPALYDMLLQDGAQSTYAILGVSRSKLTDEAFREQARASLVEFAGLSEETAQSFCAQSLYYQCLGDQEADDFQTLAARVQELEQRHDLPGNRAIYLSLPPQAFEPTINNLGRCGLNESPGWTRLVIEKPFGRDLATAQALNEVVHRHYREDQVYRIDHYLGKETVKNLLVFRFGNALFEPLWNRDHVERVDIMVTEALGVGTRAGYYDRSGALRDMIQNHLTQLFTLVAMEPPASTEANAIRYEKIKVLESTMPIHAERDVVFGQYTDGTVEGTAIPGYLDSEGVPGDSQTETYAALRLHVNNWRWQGVPFVLQTGKAMPRRLTRVSVTFRRPPVRLFQSDNDCYLASNVLHLTIQPDEGVALNFEVKVPEQGYRVQTHQLSFDYADIFGHVPDAYRTLLEDVVKGDQTLFVHEREVMESWNLYTPLLENGPAPHPYPAGSWGPSEANSLIQDAPIQS